MRCLAFQVMQRSEFLRKLCGMEQRGPPRGMCSVEMSDFEQHDARLRVMESFQLFRLGCEVGQCSQQGCATSASNRVQWLVPQAPGPVGQAVQPSKQRCHVSAATGSMSCQDWHRLGAVWQGDKAAPKSAKAVQAAAQNEMPGREEVTRKCCVLQSTNPQLASVLCTEAAPRHLNSWW